MKNTSPCRPTSSNQCTPGVSLALGKEKSPDEHEEYFVRPRPPKRTDSEEYDLVILGGGTGYPPEATRKNRKKNINLCPILRIQLSGSSRVY